MKNPVEEVRERLGLNRSQFAMAAGVSYGEVWKSETGYNVRLHTQLARFLEESGYSTDPAADYEQWRREVGTAVRSGVE